jgi:hypothetical protein
MDQHTCVCPHINKIVVCAILIGIIVCILPDNTKLVRFDFGLHLVEGAILYFSITQYGSRKCLIFWGKEYLELGA